MCKSKRTGKTLSSFNSFEEALECARYEKREHEIDLYPYKCDDCRRYHLSPKSRMINIDEDGCGCTDSNGNSKKLYSSYEDAEKARSMIYDERWKWLGIYQCPVSYGYHLTHKWY